METTTLRLFLQSLCQNSSWIYAVFWKFQHGPHLLLTWEDGYFDVRRPKACMTSITDDAYSESFNEFLPSTFELSTCIYSSGGPSIGPAVAEMSTFYYGIGEGVVGEVAYRGVPQWVFSDKIANDRFNPSFASQYADEWLPQIEAGIKTILLIPSMPDGVLQLGSFETVAEDAQLVANIKDKFAADYKSSSFWFPVGVQHQSSVISTLVENFDESSFNLSSNTGEDSRAINTFIVKEDQVSNGNNTSCIIPVSCHIFDRDIWEVQVFETGSKEDMQLVNMIDSVPHHVHQPFEQNKSETTKRKLDRNVNLHEIGVDSSFNDNNARVLWDYANEMIDFYLDGGRMEPPLNIGCNNVINQSTGNFLRFPEDCELHKALRPDIMDGRIQYMSGSSDSVGVVASSSMYNGDFNHYVISPHSDGLSPQINDEYNLLEAVVTNASDFPDYSSPNLFLNASAFQHPRGRFFADCEGLNQPESGDILGEDSRTWSCMTSAAGYGNAPGNPSPSRTSYNHSMAVPVRDQPQEKGYCFPHHRKKSNLSSNKRRARPGDHHKPRPRDRQLIQDRIKELRGLVPNGAECSIDGLLDKTIKHMAFLQSITNRADKLGQQVVTEVPEGIKPKSRETKDNGTSWAVDLASERQMCPITVKDLESPGQMLIEMVCYDYGHFLEIADVIHRLELTILRGVMDKRSDSTWAHFVVEAAGNFHRVDLFWPLMQLLQQNQLPIPSKI